MKNTGKDILKEFEAIDMQFQYVKNELGRYRHELRMINTDYLYYAAMVAAFEVAFNALYPTWKDFRRKIYYAK